MDELFLYDRDKGLFKQILKLSSVIQGRYFVSPNYGHDLNTDNIDSFIKDEKYGLTDVTQKYPCVVCMTPASLISKDNGSFIEDFYFELFFLCRSGYTGQNKVKGLDKASNQSNHHSWYDWKDMKEVAVEFLEMAQKVVKKNRLMQYISIDSSKIPVKRFSKFNNDTISGVSISFQVSFAVGICDSSDYAEGALNDITIPDLDIHTLHKH